MAKPQGIYLGRFIDNGKPTREIQYAGQRHLITIGPNGSGKGTGLIMPNLADLKRSILIIDPKGEAAAITARKRASFGRVVILNPFNELADELPHLKSHGFNPLLALDPASDHFPDDASAIAEALVEVSPKDPHWGQSAQQLLAALIMWVCKEYGEQASLVQVRQMLTKPMATVDNQPAGLLKIVHDMHGSGYPPIQAKCGRFMVTGKISDEIHSILSTAITQTNFLDSRPIAHDLERGSFDFNDMKNETVTVYVILPAYRLYTHRNWLRLMVVSALTALQKTRPVKGRPPVLFLLDEFAQLGYLPPIENAMGIARGYGIQIWPILQDLTQLQALYGKRWETFIGARGVLNAFAPQDWTTAEYLSKLCGQKTEIVESESENSGGFNLFNAVSRSVSRSPQGFPMYRPEDLMRLKAGEMLCFLEGVAGSFFLATPGYWDTAFKSGLDPNPYYHGSP
jgi:type IV secretion system protein VirD4